MQNEAQCNVLQEMLMLSLLPSAGAEFSGTPSFVDTDLHGWNLAEGPESPLTSNSLELALDSASALPPAWPPLRLLLADPARRRV